MQRVSVLGAGSFGTALALHLARQGHSTTLWGRDSDKLAQYQQAGCNSQYLPDYPFPDNLTLNPSLDAVLADSDFCVIATPSHSLPNLLEAASDGLQSQRGLVLTCKGLLGGQLPYDIVRTALPNVPCTVLSGPTFAKEIAREAPTAVSLAGKDIKATEACAELFHGGLFRVYSNDDVIGVSLGGALKNPMAIAAGIADGLGFGANTRAALITRGLTELMRLGLQMGGQPDTFMGLAGMGDLVLTCTDDLSRNRRMGLALASGKSLEQAQTDIGQVVEGVKAAKEAFSLAQQHGIEMPITEQVFRILHENMPAADAVTSLFGRERRSESER